jgi:acetyl-CoA carboxylase biotin carboxyl carrier protein
MSANGMAAAIATESIVDKAVDLDRVVEVTGALLRLLRESPVSRLAVETGSVRWEIESAPAGVPAIAVSAPVSAAAQEDGSPNTFRVVAPLVGVFYRASGPGAPPFAEPGQRVEAGQQLAIVEAMKMMNEVVADRGGIVRDVLAEDGSVVEFGQSLFAIEAE